MARSRPLRTRNVIDEMQRTRDELRLLFAPHGMSIAEGARGVFPRSRTLRWVLTHPLGRLAAIALLRGAWARLPVGRLLGSWLPGKRRQELPGAVRRSNGRDAHGER